MSGMLPGVFAALRGFRDGTLDRGEYLRACVARAEACEPWLRAFAWRPPAERLRVGDGLLAGIPVGVKDIFATADMPTANGSPIHADQVPAEDAWVVERLRGLGATVFGKTVTTEFAWREPGPTVNPHHPGHTPGGSSSGSAAAVAAGIVPLALGSQTVGSVIRPAAYCGVVGFKPSFGAVPRAGVHPLAPTLDHVGFFARAVDDVALALALCGGKVAADPDGVELPGFTVDPDRGLQPVPAPRLALVRTHLSDAAGPAQRAVLDEVAGRLRGRGAVVEELELPPELEAAWSHLPPVLQAEAAAGLGPLVERFPDRSSTWLKQLVADGYRVPATVYIEALRARRPLRARFAAVLAGFDAALTLPAHGEAPEGLALTGDASFCAPWSFLGVPAVALPAGWSPGGLPLGVQVVGRAGEDLRTLRVAKAVEEAIGWVPALPRGPGRGRWAGSVRADPAG